MLLLSIVNLTIYSHVHTCQRKDSSTRKIQIIIASQFQIYWRKENFAWLLLHDCKWNHIPISCMTRELDTVSLS